MSYCKDNNKKLAIYGASGQSNIFLSYNIFIKELGENFILVDDSDLKIGKYTPVHNIHIKPSSYLYDYNPDFTLILAFNFTNEILNKHKGLKTIWKIPLPLRTL